MKKIFAIILLMLPLMTICNAQPKSNLTGYSYRWQNGMVAGAGHSYIVSLLDDGTVVVQVTKDNGTPVTVTAGKEVLIEIQNLVNKYKMYKYDGQYLPKHDVLDGDTWGFGLKYADGKIVSAGGYVSGPKGSWEAFGAIHAYLDSIVSR